MNPTPEQSAALALITRRRKRAEQAAADVQQALLDAVEIGVPQTLAAEAAHVTRMTVWRWRHPSPAQRADR